MKTELKIHRIAILSYKEKTRTISASSLFWITGAQCTIKFIK